jgi:hypothetical protein
MDATLGLAAILRDARIGDARAPPMRAPQDEAFARIGDERLGPFPHCNPHGARANLSEQ